MGVAGSALIGRNEELARLEAFVEGTADGPPRLLLEGEAGIGKTTLWRAGVERAHELGFRVLESRPAAPERELSFAALGDLLSGTHDEIGDLPAPQRRALRVALLLEEAEGEPTDQRAVAAALLGLLRRLTADEPLVIALDDIQWLDSPSSGALQFAFRRLDNEPVRVLATSRLRAEATTMSFDDAERMEVGGASAQSTGPTRSNATRGAFPPTDAASARGGGRRESVLCARNRREPVAIGRARRTGRTAADTADPPSGRA